MLLILQLNHTQTLNAYHCTAFRGISKYWDTVFTLVSADTFGMQPETLPYLQVASNNNNRRRTASPTAISCCHSLTGAHGENLLKHTHTSVLLKITLQLKNIETLSALRIYKISAY